MTMKLTHETTLTLGGESTFSQYHKRFNTKTELKQIYGKKKNLLKPFCLFLTPNQTLFGLKYIDLFRVDRFDCRTSLPSLLTKACAK